MEHGYDSGQPHYHQRPQDCYRYSYRYELYDRSNCPYRSSYATRHYHFFSNSLTLVPISGEIPTVTQISLLNTIRATEGVLYELMVVTDRINGYEIRHADTNTTGMFRVSQVGPYMLTVTGANGCKRTARGVLVSPP